MARQPRMIVAALAAVVTTASAQQPAPAGEEGFFRPAGDPAITRVPPPAEGVVVGAPLDTALEAERRAREAAERELDRASREHLQAQSAVPAPRPMIVSPIDGSAPIVSPLDGTAPIVSPLGR